VYKVNTRGNKFIKCDERVIVMMGLGFWARKKQERAKIN
jgi:hypothetical protein